MADVVRAPTTAPRPRRAWPTLGSDDAAGRGRSTARAPAASGLTGAVGRADVRWAGETDHRPQRRVAPFQVDQRLPARRRPAGRDRRAGAPGPGGRDQHRAARRHRHRQVGDHRVAGRAAAAPDAGDGAQQDAGGPAGQRVPRAAAQQRGRVLRLLLRLLPARGVHPADGHLHREGLVDQRRGRAAAALRDQQPADPARRDRGRLGVLHLRARHPAGVRRPDGPAQGRAPRSTATSCCGSSSRSSTPATTWRSPAAPSGSAATPSRSSRSTSSSRCGSRCSATRSSG